MVAVIFTTVLEDITIGGNWIKRTQDFSILFLTTARESTTISKQNVSFGKKHNPEDMPFLDILPHKCLNIIL